MSASFYYNYSKRAQCKNCADVIWIEDPLQAVQCTCGGLLISGGTISGSETDMPIEDPAFIEILKEEFSLPLETVVILTTT